MWDCAKCGCKAIAHDLAFCPNCFKERDMPKTTVTGGPSNAVAEPGEPGYVNPEAGHDVELFGHTAQLQEHPGYGEPTEGVEHPADGTMSPSVTSEGNVEPDPDGEVSVTEVQSSQDNVKAGK